MTSTLPDLQRDQSQRTKRDVKELLTRRYTATTGAVHLTGIQALVRMIADRQRADAAIGLNTASFVSGYEGSPLAGYDLELGRQKKLRETHNILHQPAVNEELGATAVEGTQLTDVGTLKEGIDGVVGYWYGKAPGLDRAADALRHAVMCGTTGTGGAVAIVGDDPTAKSSSVPSNSSRLLADLGMPTLTPTDASDVLSLGTHAAWMSRHCGLWVGLRVTTAVADASATVILDDMTAPQPPENAHKPHAQVLGKPLLALDASRTGARLDKALEYAREHHLNRLVQASPDDTIGIIASGAAYLEVAQTLRTLGDGDCPPKVRLLRLGMTYPLDPAELSEFASGLDTIVVAEDLGTHLVESVRTVLYGTEHRPEILHTTKAEKFVPKCLEDHGIEIAAPMPKGPSQIALPLAVAKRTPHFCSGCPHNASTRTSPDTLVGGGIGCHAMVLLMDHDRVGNVIGTAQMGGEGGHWIGMSPFVQEKHLVQNLGDGTFWHSGSLAIRAMVASNVNITVKLLHNGTVAMTGGQDAVGGQGLASAVRMLQAENVKKIVVTTDDVARVRKMLPRGVEIRDRADLADVQEELAAIEGVTVLVHDQHCAAEKRRFRSRGKAERPKTRVEINPRICEGCGDCGEKSGCLSVQPIDTEFGRKTKIDQTSCNADFTCLKGDCPAFVTVVPEDETKVGLLARGGALGKLATAGRELADRSGLASAASRLGERAGIGAGFGVSAGRLGRGTSRAGATGVAKTGAGAKATLPIGLAQPIDVSELPDPGRVDLGHKSFNVRVAGVGGTGVLTVAAVLATAAQRDGFFVRGQDMTGLAQKGGSVISDVRITNAFVDQPGHLPDRGADLLLGLDALTSSEENTLDVIDGQRTTAVLSTTDSPTGRMVTDVTAQRADGVAIGAALGERVHRAVTADMGRLSTELFDAATYQTMIVLGAAVQTGSVPVRPESIEEAIQANGRSSELNIQAFRRGRQLVAAPAELENLLGINNQAEKADVPADWRDDIAMRAEELRLWGDDALAQRYLNDMRTIAAAEERIDPNSRELTKAAAFGLHKLQAYKDEYEVARLAADEDFAKDISGRYGKGASTKIMLHPPILRAMGLKKKIGISTSMMPALKTLAAAKKLRGTPLDIFGYTEQRVVERELAEVYRSVLLGAVASISDKEQLAALTDLARGADDVRGYEDLKINSARKLLERLRTAKI